MCTILCGYQCFTLQSSLLQPNCCKTFPQNHIYNYMLQSLNNLLAFSSLNNLLAFPCLNNLLTFPSLNNLLAFPSLNNLLTFLIKIAMMLIQILSRSCLTYMSEEKLFGRCKVIKKQHKDFASVK